MLSRTAADLYWLSRYFERAENTARMLDVAWNLSLIPFAVNAREEIAAPLVISGSGALYEQCHGEVRIDRVLHFFTLDENNPGSIFHCLRDARENAHAVRGKITAEMWESVNSTWLELREIRALGVDGYGASEFFDWVKNRSHLFRGVAHGTMRRGDAFEFWRMGVFIERAENTIRLLAARAHTFKPSGPAQRADTATLDYYQWGTLLRSVNAYKAYREIYKSQIDLRRVVELLTLNPEIPRSVMACVEEIYEILEGLRPRSRSFEHANDLLTRLQSARIDRIYRTGMSRFLEDYRSGLHELSLQIQKDFLMIQ